MRYVTCAASKRESEKDKEYKENNNPCLLGFPISVGFNASQLAAR